MTNTPSPETAGPLLDRAPSVLLVVLALGAVPAAFVGPSGLRLALVGLLMLAGPGGAVALWLHRQSPRGTWSAAMLVSIAVAVSLAVAVATATLMVYARWWHPTVGVLVLCALTLAGVAAGWWSRGER